MKSLFYKFLLGSFLLANTFSSCSEDQTSEQAGNKTAVNFSAGIRSRAANGQWNTNDVIGIAMLTKSEQKIIAPYSNYAYKTGGDGNFTPSQADHIIYFPEDGSEVTFKSYYPYKNDLGDISAIPLTVADQKELPAIDFMSAEHLSGYTTLDPKVEMLFYHRLSKLIFNLKLEGEEEFPLTGGELTMKGMKTTASYNLLAEALSVHAESGKDISVPAMTGNSREAIVLPRAAGEGICFEYKTTDGRVYTANMDKTLELKGGYKYTFTIILKKNPVEVSAEIEDWITVSKEFSAITVTTPASGGVNVENGELMNVYYGDSDKRTHLTDYLYTSGTDKWTANPTRYWEELNNETKFYACIARGYKGLGLDKEYLTAQSTVQASHGINFTFKHVSAQVMISLKSTIFTDAELKSAKLILPAYTLYKSGETVMDKGVFKPVTEINDLIVKETDNENNSALLPAQTIASGSEVVWVIVNGYTYKVKTSTPIEYIAGQTTQLNIAVEKTEVTVSAVITNWINVPIDLIIRPVEVSTPANSKDFLINNQLGLYILGTEKKAVYTFDGTNTWTADSKIYWDDFIDDVEEIQVAAVSTQGDLSKIGVITNNKFLWEITDQNKGTDLLMANRKVALGKSIDLEFKHALSQVIVKLVSTDGSFSSSELTSSENTVALQNILVEGIADLSKATVIYGSKTGTTQLYRNGTDFITYAIPQVAIATGTTKKMLKLKIGTRIIEVLLKPADFTDNGSTLRELTFEAGKKQTITINLQKTAFGISATVKEWETGSNGSITIH